MIKYDEDTVITGCEDGLIRAVSVLPNRIISILGDPLDTGDEIFHIQKVTLSHDKNLLASCSLDNIVKIIEVDFLKSRPMDGRSFDYEAYEATIQNKLKPNHGKMVKGEDDDMEESKDKRSDDDWSDDSDISDDSDDSDDSDSDMDDGKHKKKDRTLNPKSNTIGKS